MRLKISKVYISLGGIVLCFNSELPMEISESIREFCVDKKVPDRTINIKVMDKMIQLPPVPCGEDILLNYYNDGNRQYAVAKPGILGPLTVVVYTPDFSEATVYINEKEHPGMVRTIEKVLQLFPIRQLLSCFRSMVLHSSQVAVGNKGILFTAPSGTGKTTQAGLWNKYENAKIVCNDRTLLRKNGDLYDTYGYPLDGSSPVCSNIKLRLWAIIVLRQGNENRVQRLTVFKALKYLMEQTVTDVWNKETFYIVQQQWLEVLNRYPVYLLTCRPDQEAVICLKEQLKVESDLNGEY